LPDEELGKTMEPSALATALFAGVGGIYLLRLLAAFGLEAIGRKSHPPGYLPADFGFFLVGIDILNKKIWYFAPPFAIIAFRDALGVETWTWPLWVSVMVALLIQDTAYYFFHRLRHRSNFLWAFHKVHHAPMRMNHILTERTHPVEELIRPFIGGNLFVAAAGAPPGAMALMYAIYLSWFKFCHLSCSTVVPLRWLEWVLITPRLHRIHHSVHTATANLGGVLSVFDRLFGTYRSDGITGDRLGVEEGTAYPRTFLGIMLQPFRDVMGEQRAPAVVPAPVLAVVERESLRSLSSETSGQSHLRHDSAPSRD